MLVYNKSVNGVFSERLTIMSEKKDFLRPINSKSMVQQVIDQLTNAMIDRELRPGDKLPTEMELAASFGVGRNTVREAIKILISFGVLEIRRPEGTFVANGFSDRMIDPLLYGIILDQSESVDDLKELREGIDAFVLHLTIKKAKEEDLQIISHALDNLVAELEKGDPARIFVADDDFHAAIAEAAHNKLFLKIADLVRTLTSEMRMRTISNMKDMGRLEEMKKVHKDIFTAIEERRCEAPRELLINGYFYQYDILHE